LPLDAQLSLPEPALPTHPDEDKEDGDDGDTSPSDKDDEDNRLDKDQTTLSHEGDAWSPSVGADPTTAKEASLPKANEDAFHLAPAVVVSPDTTLCELAAAGRVVTESQPWEGRQLTLALFRVMQQCDELHAQFMTVGHQRTERESLRNTVRGFLDKYEPTIKSIHHGVFPHFYYPQHEAPLSLAAFAMLARLKLTALENIVNPSRAAEASQLTVLGSSSAPEYMHYLTPTFRHRVQPKVRPSTKDSNSTTRGEHDAIQPMLKVPFRFSKDDGMPLAKGASVRALLHVADFVYNELIQNTSGVARVTSSLRSALPEWMEWCERTRVFMCHLALQQNHCPASLVETTSRMLFWVESQTQLLQGTGQPRGAPRLSGSPEYAPEADGTARPPSSPVPPFSLSSTPRVSSSSSSSSTPWVSSSSSMPLASSSSSSMPLAPSFSSAPSPGRLDNNLFWADMTVTQVHFDRFLCQIDQLVRRPPRARVVSRFYTILYSAYASALLPEALVCHSPSQVKNTNILDVGEQVFTNAFCMDTIQGPVIQYKTQSHTSNELNGILNGTDHVRTRDLLRLYLCGVLFENEREVNWLQRYVLWPSEWRTRHALLREATLHEGDFVRPRRPFVVCLLGRWCVWAHIKGVVTVYDCGTASRAALQWFKVVYDHFGNCLEDDLPVSPKFNFWVEQGPALRTSVMNDLV
jgi:hypothetical protein